MLRFLSPYRLLYFLNMTMDLRGFPLTLPWLEKEDRDMQSTDIHSTISVNYTPMCFFREVSLKVCQWCQCQKVNQSGI